MNIVFTPLVPEVPLPHMDTIETGVDKKVKVSWTEYSCNTKDMNYVEYYEVSHCGVAEGDHGCTCKFLCHCAVVVLSAFVLESLLYW